MATDKPQAEKNNVRNFALLRQQLYGCAFLRSAAAVHSKNSAFVKKKSIEDGVNI